MALPSDRVSDAAEPGLAGLRDQFHRWISLWINMWTTVAVGVGKTSGAMRSANSPRRPPPPRAPSASERA